MIAASWANSEYRHALVNYIAKRYKNRQHAKTITRDTIHCGLECGWNDDKIFRKTRARLRNLVRCRSGRAIDRRSVIVTMCEGVETEFGMRDGRLSRCSRGSEDRGDGRAKDEWCVGAVGAVRAVRAVDAVGGEDAEGTGGTRAVGAGNIRTYLDFGCGDSSITHEIARVVRARRAIGVDVYPIDATSAQWRHITLTRGALLAEFERQQPLIWPSVEYVNATDIGSLCDGSVDLCTMLMTLHHLPDPHAVLREVRRLVRPGGRLIVREHDCEKKDVEFVCFLNAIHIYNCDDTECYYASAREWVSVVSDCGFAHVSSYSYCEPNPHRIFYACFVRRP